MTLFPQARWRGPVPNQGGQMGRILGLVLHIQEGSEAGTDAWFHNPASKVSAHFGNPKTGQLDQWVEVGRIAWAEVNGNTNWISIENEGHSGDSLTASQLENVAQLLAWLHTAYGVPLAVSDSTVPGLTGHGLGGAAWGGHTDCPGAPILAQRSAIINCAAAILGGTPTTGGTVATIPTSIAHHFPGLDLSGDFPPGATFDPDSAIAWTDARAEAAYRVGVANGAKLDQLLGRPVAPPPPSVVVDVAALAAALNPLLHAGATADECANAVVQHLEAALAKGSASP